MTDHHQRKPYKRIAERLEVRTFKAERERDAAEQERDAALWRLHQAEKRIAALEKELAAHGPRQGRLAA